MRRTFLIILAVVGGLVALLFIAVAIAVWRIDPNDLAAPIQARIKEVTGRDATIHGSIDLKLSLTPRLVLRDLKVLNSSANGRTLLLRHINLCVRHCFYNSLASILRPASLP